VLLTEQQSHEIYRGSYQLPWNSRHIEVEVRCAEDPSGRPWRELMGDLCPKLALATDPGGTPHALALRSDTLSALERAGVELARLRQNTATTLRAGRSSGPGGCAAHRAR
jgi:ParB family transcriptional regulator, chromosome partitioning protein